MAHLYRDIADSFPTARPVLVPPGQEQRIGDLGFTVVHTEAQPGFLASHGERVLRISIRISNHSQGSRERDRWVRAYLLDSQNRRWDQIPGLQGIPLSANIAPAGSVLSQPVFTVAADATDLRLVLTHGPRLPNLLVVGDRDSIASSSCLRSFPAVGNALAKHCNLHEA